MLCIMFHYKGSNLEILPIDKISKDHCCILQSGNPGGRILNQILLPNLILFIKYFEIQSIWRFKS